MEVVERVKLLMMMTRCRKCECKCECAAVAAPPHVNDSRVPNLRERVCVILALQTSLFRLCPFIRS